MQDGWRFRKLYVNGMIMTIAAGGEKRDRRMGSTHEEDRKISVRRKHRARCLRWRTSRVRKAQSQDKNWDNLWDATLNKLVRTSYILAST